MSFINDELGGWPVLGDLSNSSRFMPLEKLINLRLYQSKIFVDLSVSSNPKNPNYSVLKV